MRGFQILNTTGTVGSPKKKKKKDQTPADASVSGDDLAQNELHHCGRLDDKVVHQIMRNWARNEGKKSFSDKVAQKSSAGRRFRIKGFIGAFPGIMKCSEKQEYEATKSEMLTCCFKALAATR